MHARICTYKSYSRMPIIHAHVYTMPCAMASTRQNMCMCIPNVVVQDYSHSMGSLCMFHQGPRLHRCEPFLFNVYISQALLIFYHVYSAVFQILYGKLVNRHKAIMLWSKPFLHGMQLFDWKHMLNQYRLFAYTSSYLKLY